MNAVGTTEGPSDGTTDAHGNWWAPTLLALATALLGWSAYQAWTYRVYNWSSGHLLYDWLFPGFLSVPWTAPFAAVMFAVAFAETWRGRRRFRRWLVVGAIPLVPQAVYAVWCLSVGHIAPRVFWPEHGLDYFALLGPYDHWIIWTSWAKYPLVLVLAALAWLAAPSTVRSSD